MLEFGQLSPEEFELLCEDLLRSSDFLIESRPARGPDKGKDILATKYETDLLGNVEEQRYLVECKHFTKSGRSVKEVDIGNFQARLSVHRANRYLLITTTIPSETVKDQLSALSRDPAVPFKAGFWAKHDIIRLLQDHPRIIERYFPKIVQQHGPSFQVASELMPWMEVAGYSLKVLPSDPGDDGVALELNSPTGQIVAAFCASGEANLSSLEKTKQLGERIGAHESWLLAFSRVTPSAQARAESLKNVKVLTVASYLQSHLNNYRDSLSQYIESTGVLRSYVELGFEKPTFASDGSEIARDPYSSITAYINTWSREPSGSNILLLGDFGAGKTWIVLNYAHICLEDFWSDPIGRRVPVYIPLRDIDPLDSFTTQASQVVTKHFGKTPIGDPHAFESLNRSGRLLLLLDGFDEWGTFVDEQRLLDNIQALSGLLSPKSKILLTSRGHFFKSSSHAHSLFKKAASLGDKTETASFEVMRLSTEVSKLTGSDLEEILDLQLGVERRKRMMQQIQAFPGLRDLVSRPLLLKMVIQIFENQNAIPITTLTLYETYTRQWLDRDIRRGIFQGDAGVQDRLRFAEAVAWKMFTSGQWGIEADQFRLIMIDLFGDANQSLLNKIDYDLRTSAFLHRDSKGRFYFAHKSFMEFFAAKWIFRSLQGRNSQPFNYISDNEQYAFSPEIDDFLGQLVDKANDIQFLKDVKESNAPSSKHAQHLLTVLKAKGT